MNETPNIVGYVAVIQGEKDGELLYNFGGIISPSNLADVLRAALIDLDMILTGQLDVQQAINIPALASE